MEMWLIMTLAQEIHGLECSVESENKTVPNTHTHTHIHTHTHTHTYTHNMTKGCNSQRKGLPMVKAG